MNVLHPFHSRNINDNISLDESRGFKIFRAASFTFLDQLALSFVQFIIGLGFIYNGTTEQYGAFTFLMAIFYFFTSAQNAMINTPLMVLTPRMAEEERISFERGIFGSLCICISSVVLLVLFWAGSLLMQNNDKKFTIVQIVIFAFYLGPLMLRGFWRAEEYAKLQPAVALRRDLKYAGLTLIMVALIIVFGVFGVSLVFAAMAVAALLVVIPPSLEMCRPIPRWHEVANSFQRVWEFSRWSVLGAASSWFQNSAYVYLPFFLIGAREVAYLAAARLVMMPPALLAGSWSNYFRPLASRKLSEGDLSGTVRILFTSTLSIVSLLFLFTAFVLFVLKAAPETWLPKDYRGIGDYVIYWAVIIFLMTARSNASSIFQASLAFKTLALRALLSAIFTVIITTGFVLKMGEVGALVGQMAGELLLVLILMLGLREVVRSNTGSKGVI